MNELAVLAAALAGLAVLGGGGPGRRAWAARLRGVPAEPRASGPVNPALPRVGLLAAVGLGAWALGGLTLAAPALSAVLVAVTAETLVARHRRRAVADRRADDVVRAGEVLAGLLRVGQVPATALVAAARESEALAEAAAVQDVGGDVAAALRRAASVPGQDGLADLARAWEVSRETGASMCDSIEAASERLASEHETERTVAAELSAPRASGRLMGALPLVGVFLGYGFGGDPLAFLSGTTGGRVCLLAGVGLACLGLWWTDTIAAKGQRR